MNEGNKMISREEYQARRLALAEALEEGAIAIIPAADEILRNGDSHYRFRQNSHFYYLTGFNEPEALLLITSGKNPKTYLFNRSRNPTLEQWTGRRLGQEDAPKVLAIHEAYSIESLETNLVKLLEDTSTVYYPLGQYPFYEKLILKTLVKLKGQIRRGVKAPGALKDIDPIISELRLFKSKSEIDLMRKAAAISVQAHQKAMQVCKELKNEAELEAELLYIFAKNGCRAVAYDPIVGAGENACVLHYTDNNKPLKNGDLVLIDAAGEYENYAADITRTFPVSGTFTEDQKAIYELVLKSQKAGIACVKPGAYWDEVQETIVKILTEGLLELGILKGSLSELLKEQAYKPFYMHSSGHWLGLDVHDAGSYKERGQYRKFKPGMVLTVEPGLYISAGIDGVDKRWWNIGVRIEDDILVTEKGHENLTQSLPVEVAEIEALMRG